MKIIRIMSALLCFCVLLSATAFPISAENKDEKDIVSTLADQSSYSQYINNLPSDKYADKEIVISADTFKSTDSPNVAAQDFVGKSAVVVNNAGGNIVWDFYCDKSALYAVNFVYYPIVNKGLDVEVGIMLDGEYCYDEMQTFFLPRVFMDSAPIKQDSNGNDYNSEQIEVGQWLDCYFNAADGSYDDPMLLYVTQGVHTFTLVSKQEPFALAEIKLCPVQTAPDYAEYLSAYKSNSDDKWSKTIEAETTYRKSDRSLLAQSDRGSIYTSPFSYKVQRLNCIGGEKWHTGGEWIEWELNVPEDGYYHINFRYSQSYTQGFPANRRLYINGKVPFKQADNLQFDFCNGWDFYTPSVDGKEALFFLQKGSNILRLEVTLGEVAEIARVLEDIVLRLNDYYRRIIMITGSTPDSYRDYNLESEITGMMDDFKSISKSLKENYDYIRKLTDKKGNSGNILKVLSYQLDDMLADPASIPFRMDSFSSNIGSLSSWALDIKSQALDLDYIYVSSAATEGKPKYKENVFEAVKREVLFFAYSFVIDYNSFDSADNSESISVWSNTGRDQLSIIRRMIDDMFTPQENIAVSLKLTNANAMQAFLSGNAPDVMINVDRGQPVNLALRGALYDVSGFDDYADAITAFSDTAAVPYELNGGVYALPETERFYMMFMRNDILAELGIKTPETWEQFYEAIQIIQLEGMRVGVPYTGVDSSTAVDSGIGGKNLFSAFLLQKGGSFYSEDLTKTALDSKEAIWAFEEWTALYTEYDLDLSYNFFNRFRTGEMPLAIALYNEYNQLRAAAPEIYGTWSMVPIPATVKADGTLDRSQGGTGTACVITSVTKHAEAAWKFIKWWTGADAQTRYASDLEAAMGVAARHPTANLTALSNIQWTQDEYSALSRQIESVIEIPVAAGSYYLNRGVDNAFRETVYDGRNAKEALSVWNREITDEITRKREEFFDEE